MELLYSLAVMCVNFSILACRELLATVVYCNVEVEFNFYEQCPDCWSHCAVGA